MRSDARTKRGKVLTDCAYDADSLHDLILEQGGEPVIPPGRYKYQHHYDCIAYKLRWGTEGFFAKLKQWRRITTRYGKLAAIFLGLIKIANIMPWLKLLIPRHNLEHVPIWMDRTCAPIFYLSRIRFRKPLHTFQNAL